MCGIAGIFNVNGEPVSPVILRKMTDAISHRGPDGEGFYIDSFVGLGHRRLAIIDLSPSGHQPMITLDKQYALTYNGEIYNFQELRLELEAMGYSFHSRTDSEMVLYAYAAWGSKCVDKFNGMFAFAIWDKKKQELFLARDRYGIKPLYYSMQNKTFLFGSEQKALFAHPSFTKALDKKALLEYFTFQNIFTNKTLLEGVSMLPAGCWAKLALGDQVGNIQINRYWDYCFREPDTKVGKEEYIEELDRLFQQAVNRQLISDVDVGAYLSGGMDSGSITAIATKTYPFLKSFTCGFDLSSASGIELSYDERRKAEAMSARFKTEHYEVILKAGDMERCLPKVSRALEEPRVGQSYPNYYAAQLASKFVKVVLSGAGGDELFGGYPWRYYRAVNCDNFEQYIDKYYVFWQRLMDNRDIKKVFSPIWKDVQGVWTRDIFRDVFLTHENELDSPEDYINHSLYFEAKTFLHGLFVVEDKLSMAHSLETRVPFMDNDLVDFAMQCPVNLKLNNLAKVTRINENMVGDKQGEFFKKTKDGKQILRDVMRRYIREDIVKAEKQGFSSPDASWFKGESIEFVRRKLMQNNSKIYKWMDRASVQNLVQEHLSGKENRRLLVWSLLNVEEFINENDL